ncbi:MAG: hypothetical protein IPK82_19315 [Polyangiaceae bacterium]|nr:hypothetical protein [Polyangiaceae bacterium]
MDVASNEMHTSLTRVAFCGTDGIEQLQIFPLQKGDLAPNITASARRIAYELHEASEVQNIQVNVQQLPNLFGKPSAVAVVNGDGHRGPLLNVFCFFSDEKNRPWCMSQSGTAAMPAEVLVQGLVAAMRSFRHLKS